MSNQKDPFGFIDAIGNKTPVGKRMFFELPDGKIGVTAVYLSEEVLSDIRKEAESHGHKYLRTETVKD